MRQSQGANYCARERGTFWSLLPVRREKVRMRVIWDYENFSTIEITLTPALSRSTGRGGNANSSTRPNNLNWLSILRSATAPMRPTGFEYRMKRHVTQASAGRTLLPAHGGVLRRRGDGRAGVRPRRGQLVGRSLPEPSHRPRSHPALAARRC